jgi:hypothetical protein
MLRIHAGQESRNPFPNDSLAVNTYSTSQHIQRDPKISKEILRRLWTMLIFYSEAVRIGYTACL